MRSTSNAESAVSTRVSGHGPPSATGRSRNDTVVMPALGTTTGWRFRFRPLTSPAPSVACT
jgi:hypothetical protein